MMAFSGVRISWLMFAMNSDFAALAASARRSARWRTSTSRRRSSSVARRCTSIWLKLFASDPASSGRVRSAAGTSALMSPDAMVRAVPVNSRNGIVSFRATDSANTRHPDTPAARTSASIPRLRLVACFSRTCWAEACSTSRIIRREAFSTTNCCLRISSW